MMHAAAILVASAGIAAIAFAADNPQRCEPRMPEWQSQAIKREMTAAAGVRMQDVELDHIIPLCLCGSNDRSNLQLQPWPEARRKDAEEVALCRSVSRGEMSQEDAVRRMREWRP